MNPSKRTSSDSNCFRCGQTITQNSKFLGIKNVRATENSHIDFTMGDVLNGEG